MNINIELKKNFINAYNRMQNDYGEEMAKSTASLPVS